MEATIIPPVAWVLFGGAFVAGLSLFGCLVLITRRLGVSWQKTGLNYSLHSGDSARIGKMLFGIEKAPADARVGSLLWAVRGCWAAMVVLIVSFALILAGAA